MFYDESSSIEGECSCCHFEDGRYVWLCVSCVYIRYLRVILKNDMCEKMLVFVRKLVVMLCKRFILRKCLFGGEIRWIGCCWWVSLCRIMWPLSPFYRFWAVVHFLGVLREESSNRRRMLTKWFEGFLLVVIFRMEGTGRAWLCFVLLFLLSHFRNCF